MCSLVSLQHASFRFGAFLSWVSWTGRRKIARMLWLAIRTNHTCPLSISVVVLEKYAENGHWSMTYSGSISVSPDFSPSTTDIKNEVLSFLSFTIFLQTISFWLVKPPLGRTCRDIHWSVLLYTASIILQNLIAIFSALFTLIFEFNAEIIADDAIGHEKIVTLAPFRFRS